MPGPKFWSDEEAALWAAVSGTTIEALLAGMEGGVDTLPPELQALVNFDTLNTDALRFAREYRYTLIKGINDTTMRQVQEAMNSWILSGDPLSTLEDTLTPIFGKVRAQMIASTEITRIFAEGNSSAWASTGFVTQQIWMTARDDRVCPICGPKAGQVYNLNDTGNRPPAHVRCVLPDNIVIASDVLAAAKSFYRGYVVEITTNSGRKITVTKNHPILTSSGWIRADRINDGMDLFVTVNGQRMAATINPDYDYRPSTIEQVFSSFEKSNGVISVAVPSSAKDFNGDGRNVYGDINVIHANGLLLSDTKPLITQPICDHVFRLGNMRLPVFNGNSMSNLFSHAELSAFGGFMSGGNLSQSLLGGHARPLDKFGLGLSTNMNTGINQITSKRGAADTDLARKFILRFSGDIATDKVINVRNIYFSGHVYDLQTKNYELYTCNDIITHNCRCYMQPVVDVDAVLAESQRLLNG